MKTTRSKPIRNCAELRCALRNQYKHPERDQHEFTIVLMGGGVHSRKDVWLRDDNRFHVFNYIDETEQILTGHELYTRSNIGEAMRKRAFYSLAE